MCARPPLWRLIERRVLACSHEVQPDDGTRLVREESFQRPDKVQELELSHMASTEGGVPGKFIIRRWYSWHKGAGGEGHEVRTVAARER